MNIDSLASRPGSQNVRISHTVDSSTISQLLRKVKICEGQADNHFIRMVTDKKRNILLNTPEKKMKVDVLKKKRVHTAEASVKRLIEKVKKLTEDHGETIDSELP